jgi:RNA polymerase sigma-70 factor (ECF subfamily)
MRSNGRVRDPAEKVIVDGLRRGERGAFDAAYDRHRARVFGFLLRLARRRDVAEDLLQETWLRLARAAPSLAEDTDLAAWLFTVARNQFVSWRRWAALDLSRLVTMGDEPIASAEPSPADATDATRSMARLEAALGSLPAAQREVLLLVGVEGFDQEQAAEILGVRYDALRQRLSRARAELAGALEKMERSSAPRARAVGA